MKSVIISLAAALMAIVSANAADWIPMLDGKDLAAWKSNAETEGKSDVFTLKDGVLVVDGGRAHLFYVGPDGNAKFKNFEFKAKVKTTPGSNSGIYFHTAFQPNGWPDKGFECQVNATHTDRKKTGGLYAVADVLDKAPHKDGEWFDYGIKVDGKRIVITIDGKVTTDWTQPGPSS
jgi:opacity protein-like surface antigen